MAKRVRFNHSQIQRARQLLHMRYKPSELARIIDCSANTIYRSCIPAGCPYERDETGHLWIVGTEFRDWMLAIRREQVAAGRAKLKDGQGYCVICEKAVTMEEPFTIKPVGIHLELLQGRCPECGAVVSRGRKRTR